MRTLALLLAFARCVAFAAPSSAKGVGLGVAVGINSAKPEQGVLPKPDRQASFAWGFFVDIPLIETFYISPAAMIYELDAGGGGKAAVTDVDLNFKFIVPLRVLKLGAGVTAGLSTGLGPYRGHFGGLGYLSLGLVSNLEAFALLQYKRVAFGAGSIDNVHAYAGGMFRF